MWPNTECSEGMMGSTMGNIQRQADEVRSSLDRLNDLLKQQVRTKSLLLTSQICQQGWQLFVT